MWTKRHTMRPEDPLLYPSLDQLSEFMRSGSDRCESCCHRPCYMR